MSSFLNKLFKGFIRSAVNQVGRDGGRVVSNKVYKDNHSIPIRNVNNNQEIWDIQNPTISKIDSDSSNDDNIHLINRNQLISKGFQPELFSNSFLSNFFVLIGSFATLLIYPVSIVTAVYWFYLGLKNLLKTTIPFYRIEKVPIYKQDKRYSEGKRIEGHKEKKYIQKLP
ncbi:hypothetical protein [Mongoliitalea daihaiensis]|uniref:hypothetical protein n=1 Tax=Mongoliitalea daihaiensis TaxID=2782006 RepID=UPI001F1DCB39|nr:hypothetical protein [Mongoliitalea daihaiensis]UJP63681.1 hypothetical protein IPZ59_12650 [Mongoliitalea daihaiensis]